MKLFIIISCVIAATQQAALSLDSNTAAVEPLVKYMPVLDDAPVYRTVSTKIVQGLPASRGQFPYQAALYLDGRTFCGGSLISDSWILTAAHCTVNIQQVTAHLGAVKLDAEEEGRVSVSTRVIINHANYNHSTLNNDIALIYLPDTVPLSQDISAVPLPSYSQAYETFIHRRVRASGWGWTSDAANTISMHLHYVDEHVIDNSVCELTYGSNVIVPSTLCVSGTGRRNTCKGDSGGPLVTVGNNPTLIGVVSFVSDKGCESDNPSGYMRVTSYLDWIHDISGIHISK